jgi:hypothetical protein
MQEVLIGGPQIFSEKEIVDLAFQGNQTHLISFTPKVSRMTPKYRNISSLVLTVVATVSKAFDENTSSMLQWALASGGTEQIAPQLGALQLEQYLKEIYNGHPSPFKPGFFEVNVHSGTVFEKFVTVEIGATVSWEFLTIGRDISFSVSKTDSNGSIVQTLLQLQKAQSQTVPVVGKIIVEEPGTYLLKWDNTYSLLTAKILSYKITVTEN